LETICRYDVWDSGSAGEWPRIEAKGPSGLVVVVGLAGGEGEGDSDGQGGEACLATLGLASSELEVHEEKEVAGVESKEPGGELSGVEGEAELAETEERTGVEGGTEFAASEEKLKVVAIGVIGSSSRSASNVCALGVVGEASTTSNPPMEVSSSLTGLKLMVRVECLGVENESD
jgi:hypothetical protein